MATGGDTVATVLGDISRDHLECGICHERYQTPKILNCLHSFCEKCLLTYQKTLRDTSVVSCPLCRRDSPLPPDGVVGLKTNFHLKEIVDDFALKEKLTQTGGLKILCELCEDQREAQSRCMDCPFLLCQQCQAGHQRIAVTAHHEVLALDALRTGVADLQRKRKIEPLCQKHQGEKKRFFCESCKELICRDCTVVEHRNHNFTTIDDAAPRLRKNVQKQIQELKRQMSLFNKSKTDIQKMDSQLVQSVSQVELCVTRRASSEEIKIDENLRTVREGISSRSTYRSQTLQENGVSLTECMFKVKSLPKNKNPKLAQDTFSTIDKDLGALNDSIKKLLSSDKTVRTVIQQFSNTSENEARIAKSKVAASQKKLMSQIQIISTKKQKFLKDSNKVVGTEIERMRHALETANNLLTSASDADFLSLQSVIDSDIRSLLEKTPPKIPSGYQKLSFLESSTTELGRVVFGATWSSVGDIKPCSTPKTADYGRTTADYGRMTADHGRTTADHGRTTADYRRTTRQPVQEKTETKDSTITNIAAFGKNEVLVGFEDAVVVYNTSGKRTWEYITSSDYFEREEEAVYVSSFSNGSFVGITANPKPKIYWFETKSSEPTKTFHLSYALQTSECIATTSYGKGKLLIGAKFKGNQQQLMVFDCFSGLFDRQQPVQIQPDFLACMGEDRVLIGARSPARVQGLKISGETFMFIDPTAECSSEVEGQNCLGLCSDGRDYTYVVLSVRSAEKLVHVHQYTHAGSFVGCSVLETEKPIKGLAVTGDGTLVLAEQHKLRLFVVRQ